MKKIIAIVAVIIVMVVTNYMSYNAGMISVAEGLETKLKLYDEFELSTGVGDDTHFIVARYE